jgi:hypothetical protein
MGRVPDGAQIGLFCTAFPIMLYELLPAPNWAD